MHVGAFVENDKNISQMTIKQKHLFQNQQLIIKHTDYGCDCL